MLKLIKKYRCNPKRIVVTFSFQKKMILNRLGDLTQKKELRETAGVKGVCSDSCVDLSKCDCIDGYVLENKGACKTGNEAYDSKREQIELEQAQMLEKDGCRRAFKENYHIKPLEYDTEKQKASKKSPVEAEKDMRGGIVCERSFKMLLCDLAAGAGAIVFLTCLLGKLKSLKR